MLVKTHALSSPDAIVVGAGPVGSLTALAFARRGGRVLLLEAAPDRPKRMGGEWIHPTGVQIMNENGIALPRTADFLVGQGFVVFPDDESDPIILPYQHTKPLESQPLGSGLDGDSLATDHNDAQSDRRCGFGLSCEHGRLVDRIRQSAVAVRGITYLPGARVIDIDGQRLTCLDRSNQPIVLRSKVIVGADGRASTVRKCLGLPDRRTRISCMAGVLLSDVELPFEGYGHVVLGGPGPVLLYRIGSDQVRACLDVPLQQTKRGQRLNWLKQHFTRVLPSGLQSAFARAISGKKVLWATNDVRPRNDYRSRNVALVGDAVGCSHPMTANGMTLGFQDGALLAQAGNLTAYQRRRRRDCQVPEWLASSLYAAFVRNDEEAAAIRQAIFSMWRSDASARSATMELLCANSTSRCRYVRILMKVAAMSVKPLVSDILQSRQWRQPGVTFDRLRRQLLWKNLPPRAVCGGPH